MKIRKNDIYRNKTGEVYTPEFIVDNILDMVGYNSNKKIYEKQIIDNSCGQGAFLIKIVERFLKSAQRYKVSENEIIKLLELNVHAIEIEENSIYIATQHLNEKLKEFGIFKKVKWDIVHENALTVTKFNEKMDFVVGNPPYIRIHDLNFEFKNFEFATKGMIDLYLIFFELGIKMMNQNGKMGYITPNSFYTSSSGYLMRKYLIENKLLSEMVNLKHFNPFKGVTTYPAITILDKNHGLDSINFYKYDQFNMKPEFCNPLKYSQFWLDECFYFDTVENLNNFKSIINTSMRKDFDVKNGVSSNLDSFFYNRDYSGKYVNKAYKASTGNYTKVFFPYDENLNTTTLKSIKEENSKMYSELTKFREQLENRSLQSQKWFEFARTQGIKDVNETRFAINSIVRTIDSIKLKEIEPGCVIYSGLYILDANRDFQFYKNLICEQEFVDYLKILGKDKNGEYYCFSSLDLKKYLSFKMNQLEIINSKVVKHNARTVNWKK